MLHLLKCLMYIIFLSFEDEDDSANNVSKLMEMFRKKNDRVKKLFQDNDDSIPVSLDYLTTYLIIAEFLFIGPRILWIALGKQKP